MSASKTSVPTVIPLQEFKFQVAKLMELAILTGDTSHFKESVKLARFLYESQMKEAANIGRLDHKYLNRIRVALERAEANCAVLKE